MREFIFALLLISSSLNMFGRSQAADSVLVGGFYEHELPDDFDGGLGYFYKSEKQKQAGCYVFVFDLTTRMAVKLDGVFLVLPLVECDEKQKHMVFANDNYKVTVSKQNTKAGEYESFTYSGFAVVESLKKKVRSSKIVFTGECVF
ncbi:MAG: hypothetical protein J5663_04305 [Bacteroidaceae bacterium]|nr:hypothetical protein [Bacteroidaceae bacterium]